MTGEQWGWIVGCGLLAWFLWDVGASYWRDHQVHREMRERAKAQRGGESYVMVEVDTVEISPDGILCRGMTRNPDGRTIRVQFVGTQAQVDSANRATADGRVSFFVEVPASKTVLIDGEVTGPSG